jgi:YidC/Oxa1 family membrane protein insertase
MTDMRRTLLWVVFTMSLVLLWDAWNKHTGQPSLFGGRPAPRPAVGGGPRRRRRRPQRAGGRGRWPPTAAHRGAPTGRRRRRPPPRPRASASTITTDRRQGHLRQRGRHAGAAGTAGYRDQRRPHRNVVLFDQTAKRLYLAQTGLITAQPGVNLPNHLTPMTALPGERT